FERVHEPRDCGFAERFGLFGRHIAPPVPPWGNGGPQAAASTVSAFFGRSSLASEVTRTSVIDFFTSADFLASDFCVYSRVRISPSTCTCAPLVSVAAYSPSFPHTMQRCQVVCDWRWPDSRPFQPCLVAS